MAAVSFGAVLLGALRKPGEAAANAVEGRINVKLATAATQLAVYVKETDAMLEQIRCDIREEEESCAERMAEIRTTMSEHDARLRDVSEKMVQSREDRRHLTQSITELRSLITDWRKEDQLRHDSMMRLVLEKKG